VHGAGFRGKRRSDRINRIYRIGFGRRRYTAKGTRYRVHGARYKVHGIEEIEEAVDVALDAQLTAVPGRGRVPGPQVLHLEPVFDVDGD